jgi:hypothetical protein
VSESKVDSLGRDRGRDTYPLWYRRLRTHRHARDRREFERLSAVRNAEEAAKALEDAQHVYIFAAREYVKVGVTSDPVGRWQQIRCGNPLLERPFHVTQKKYGNYILDSLGRKRPKSGRQAGKWVAALLVLWVAPVFALFCPSSAWAVERRTLHSPILISSGRNENETERSSADYPHALIRQTSSNVGVFQSGSNVICYVCSRFTLENALPIEFWRILRPRTSPGFVIRHQILTDVVRSEIGFRPIHIWRGRDCSAVRFPIHEQSRLSSDVHGFNLKLNGRCTGISDGCRMWNGYPRTVAFSSLSGGFFEDLVSDGGINRQSYKAEHCYARRHALPAFAAFLLSVFCILMGGWRAWHYCGDGGRIFYTGVGSFCFGLLLCTWSASILITHLADAENGYTYYCQDSNNGDN